MFVLAGVVGTKKAISGVRKQHEITCVDASVGS
jgi:hypothetical protein